jgi:hypothetical protein
LPETQEYYLAPDREGRRGEERRGDDADSEAEHDSPSRKRSISGSGDDAAY